ncbi:MAG: serine/threonine-protein kinase [Opitutaceae bacterium]
MSSSSNREEEIFAAALALPVEERAAYLAQTCGGDLDLCKRIEALLRAHQASPHFMESPPPDVLRETSSQPLPPKEETPGDRIGRYKLLQKIGEGGCGVVYMAEQEDVVRRRVALKVIKLGMDTKAVIARFEAERQALSRMEHPNIASVLDAGMTASGRPFFVMELVRGIKITDYCDQNNLTTPERLDLFIKVCHAIQHAHQKGIIHRDIKPSNILVTLHDHVPVPKVIDFGIAKATQGRLTDQTLFTAFEQFIGTPAYVSPEQAEMTGLDVDTRSDIYSLGVLLYELLTGRTPFDTKKLVASGLDEMRRQIREQEPPRPSARVRTLAENDRTTVARQRGIDAMKFSFLLRGDLDWIVMRCLEKDRARRFETANALAQDLQRYLHNEPVTARPPSTAYLAQKLVRRHRLAFGTGAVIALLVAVGFAVSTTLFLRARQAERRVSEMLDTAVQEKDSAERARGNEARLRRKAEAEEQKAQSEASHRTQVAASMKEMLSGISQLVLINGDEKLARRILDQTAAGLKKDLSGQPEVEADLRETLGGIYFKVGEFDQAVAMFREALALRRQRESADPTAVAQSLNYLGLALTNPADFPEAERSILEAIALQEKSLGKTHPAVPQSRSNLGWVLSRQEGRLREAEKLVQEALAEQRTRGVETLEVAESLKRLGAIYEQEARFGLAEQHLNEALVLYRKLLGRDHVEVASSLHLLAVTLVMDNKLTAALECYREAIDIRERLKNPGATRPPEMLASVLEPRGNLAEVEAALREARRFARTQYAKDSWEQSFYIAMSAYVLLQEGKFPEAEANAKECLAIREKLRPEDWSTFHARNLLGGALAGQKRFAEAEPLLIESYRGMKEREATFPPGLLVLLPESQLRIAKFYTDWGRPAEAAEWQKKYEAAVAAGTKP